MREIEMYENNRSHLDMKRWNPLIDQIFYEKNPNNPKEIRTYTMKWNGMANKITPMISNYHQAEPTPEMKPFHPRLMTGLNAFSRHNNGYNY